MLSFVSLLISTNVQIYAHDVTVDDLSNMSNLSDNAIIITSENEHMIGSNEYDAELNMTYSEVLNLYNDYIGTTISLNNIDAENVSEDSLEGFLQYAIENGVIEDTTAEKAALSKAFYRTQFKAAVAAGNALGYTTAADFLDHSLQDNPSSFICDSSTSYASQILNSEEIQSIISSFKASVSGTSLTTKNMSGSIALDSTTDLHLAYNNVDYVVFGAKTNGVWDVSVTITDTYDFKHEEWKNAMTDNAVVTMINNYAYDAQQVGAIVPYTIRVTARTSF